MTGRRADELCSAHEPSRRHSASVDLPADAASGSRARRYVTRLCTEWGIPAATGDAGIVVTELVENAVRHGGTGCTLTVHHVRDGLTIAVRDGSRVAPNRVDSAASQPGGRGLLLVERLSSRWGYHVDDLGKSVWAIVPTGDTAAAK